MDIFLIALLIHLSACAVIFFLIKRNILHISIQIFPFALFVPVFGIIIIVSADYLTRKKKNGTKSIEGLHSFTLDDDDYRRITMIHEKGIDAVVPLEEAISINNAKTRRQFMMNVANQKDGEYTPLLQKARLNDDVEVAHYASTAIMELLRKYEINIQKCKIAYVQDEEDISSLDSLIMAYKIYISSGLLEDKVLEFQREKYGEVLRKRMNTGQSGIEIYCDAAENQMALGNLDGAESILDEAVEKWQNIESVWKMKLRLCKAKGDRKGMTDTIEVIRQSGIFLSSELRESISFWTGQ